MTTTIGAGFGDEFAAQLDAHRRDLTLLCYRFLGSLTDAEEAVQETIIRAWRGRAGFRGDASLRTWLHRIATRVCLDLLARRRRVLPIDVSQTPADPGRAPEPPLEVPWLEPLPDTIAALGPATDAATDPLVRATARESVSLAFTAALQALPPRQRAVLILRDVIGWTAAETAETLDMTVGAANSALHRARRSLETSHHRSGIDGMSTRRPADPAVRHLLDAYVRAWEADDVAALVATLRRDARLAMPPSPSWYAGPAAIGSLLERWVFGAGAPGRFRLPLVTANGGSATLIEERRPDGDWITMGIQVLAIDTDGIVDIVAFLDPAIAARFGPPPQEGA